MTVEGERFITEMLRGIGSDMTDVKERMLNMELRQTAIEHHLAGIDTHLIALQHSVSGLTADMRRVKQRLELVDE